MKKNDLDLYVVGVIVIIPNAKGEILVGQRLGENQTYWGMNEVPSGKLEYRDVSLKKAAEREVLEETNLTVELVEQPIFIKHYPHSSSKNPYGLLAVTYLATKIHGTLITLGSFNLTYKAPEETLKLKMSQWTADAIKAYLKLLN